MSKILSFKIFIHTWMFLVLLDWKLPKLVHLVAFICCCFQGNIPRCGLVQFAVLKCSITSCSMGRLVRRVFDATVYGSISTTILSRRADLGTCTYGMPNGYVSYILMIT